MIVTFFKTGKGSAKSAFNYLLNAERVKNGTAKLLSGNPDVITFLTEQRMKDPNYRGGALYTSGVLSFSADDSSTLDDRKLRQIMNRFEKTLFPSLDRARFNVAWVLHTDKNRTELHFVIQNFDLETKKTITPFVAERDLARVNSFKNKVNEDFNLSNPDLVNPHYHAKNVKKLSAEQQSFYKELNQAYSKHIEEKTNPSLTHQVKGFLSRIIGQNEPQKHDLHSNEDKSVFLQKFITERFKGLKINRSSDKYASIDFDGSKMRLFFEKPKVKDLESAIAVKVEQNKAKGLSPFDSADVFAQLTQSYNARTRAYNAEKERLRLEKERAEQERLQREKEAEKERLRLAEIEKQKAIDYKFNQLLNGSRDVFIKQVINEVIEKTVKQACSNALKPEWVGWSKVHDLLFEFEHGYPDDLKGALSNIQSKLKGEYGLQRYSELENKGFFNLEPAFTSLKRVKNDALDKLKNMYIDYHAKSSVTLFNAFKKENEDYISTHSDRAINYNLRPYAKAFLNEITPIIEKERERFGQSLQRQQQQTATNRIAMEQPKPNAPKMRM